MQAHNIDERLAAALRGEIVEWDEGPLDEEFFALFVERLRFHGIAALIDAKEANSRNWPEPLRKIIAEEVRLQRLWEDTHREVLLPVLARFAEAGIEAVVMKGTALAYQLYENPIMRPRGDTDVMIASEQRSRAAKILQECGLSLVPVEGELIGQEIWRSPERFGFTHFLDLHWGAHTSPALRKVLGETFLLERAVPLSALSPSAKAPRLAALFLGCAINQANHAKTGFDLEGRRVTGEGRLGWAYDIHLFMRCMAPDDWEEATDFALRAQIAPSVLKAMQQAHETLGTVLPDDVVRALSAQQKPDAINVYFDQHATHRGVMMDLRHAGSLRNFLTLMRKHLFPDRERMKRLRPDYPDWPLPLLQLRRIASYPIRRISGKRW